MDYAGTRTGDWKGVASTTKRRSSSRTPQQQYLRCGHRFSRLRLPGYVEAFDSLRKTQLALDIKHGADVRGVLALMEASCPVTGAGYDLPIGNGAALHGEQPATTRAVPLLPWCRCTSARAEPSTR